MLHCVCAPHFISPSVDGHVGCFHLLALVSRAAMNMGVQISFRDLLFCSLVYIPRSGIVGLYIHSIFNFGGAIVSYGGCTL